MTKDEALKLALEALEYEAEKGNDDAYRKEREAIKEALAQPEHGNPAVVRDDGNICYQYTTPPQRTWVGLTQQDIDIAFDDTQEGGGFNEFARAIEVKLKEKNHG